MDKVEGKMYTPEEFAAEMARLQKEYEDDEELVHICMDNTMLELLRALGYGKGCDIFDNTKMWYA